jgi:hypothetical protein
VEKRHGARFTELGADEITFSLRPIATLRAATL